MDQFHMTTQNIRLIAIICTAGVLLLIPYIAMRFTTEVNWTAFDFAAMGFMLLCTGLAIEFALRIFKVTWVRVAAVLGVLLGFVMVWGALVRMGG